MQIQLYLGERNFAAYNKKLGMFELAGIAPAPRGMPQIEVTFDIDANGILSVSAMDLGTGKQQTVNLSSGFQTKVTTTLPNEDIERIETEGVSQGLSDEEIELMLDDARKYAEEDRGRVDRAETRNRAETLTYTTAKFVSENEERIPEDMKSEVSSAIADVKRTLEGTDTEAIRTATEKAAQVSQKMGSAIYAQAQAKQPKDDWV